MGINVDWTPSSAAPALYGAALGAGQEQFRNRRQQELMQLAELDQRQQALQANLYNQQQNRILDAQQAAQDRAFRAQAMQFGAAQDIFQQQQHFLQQQELEQDNWFNQQEESGALIRDAASRMKLQKFYAQQGAIRSAPNLTLQDKQMKLMELGQQIRDERRGGLREPLPGERQKSFEERVKSSTYRVPVRDPDTGEWIGDKEYTEAPGRNGQPPSVRMDFVPAPRQTGIGSAEIKFPSISRTLVGPGGTTKSLTTTPNAQEQRAAKLAAWQEAQAPTLELPEQLGSLPVGTLFKGPSGLFFERDESPEGYHEVPNPTDVVKDQFASRSEQEANKVLGELQAEADQKKREAADKEEIALRKALLQTIIGETDEVKGEADATKKVPRFATDAEIRAELERRLNLLRGVEAPSRQQTFGKAPTPESASTIINDLERSLLSGDNAKGRDAVDRLLQSHPELIPALQSGIATDNPKELVARLRRAIGQGGQRSSGRPTGQPLPIPSEAGNIDLSNRPVVRNEDGTISTVRSISISTPRGVYLIPTVSDDGRIMPDQEAVATFQKSGRHLGRFKNEREADAYAEQLHQQQARAYGNPNMPPLPPVPQPSTQAEYDALPSGSLYRFTDGRIMRKP